jgi:hypothetical protein
VYSEYSTVYSEYSTVYSEYSTTQIVWHEQMSKVKGREDDML